ncbi:MAG: hybrid sensor histidine kinase/response regulator, partial [Deltaproteobacteria bacterium]|nr:hybrid sensor histidine kinase/response regulator [Deltaproteobacteria bacterium]
MYFGMNEGVCFNEVIYDKSGEAVDFRIFDVNPAYETLLGLKKDQVVGSLGSELYGTDGMAFLDMYKKVLDSGKRIAYEFYWPITAKYFNISVFCSVKDLFAVFFMDITGQREAQRKEREKFELQLKQAQKMEAIGTLAGGIAHDFNNILMPIILQTELALLEINDNNILCSRLQKILEASLRARDLVKQILTFSRQDERQAIPLNMTTIIKEAVKLLRPTLPRTIEIRLNLESSSDMVMADPTQIHQVLINLCTNAAHAMRNKDSSVLDIGLRNVEIDAKTAAEHPDLKPGSYVRMTVSDTGHGIDPSVINRIFDPFFTTKTRGEGTGMGLSVVHSIVRSCGGAITVKSKPGKGSVFHVYFPQFERKASITTESVQALPVGNERILVV